MVGGVDSAWEREAFDRTATAFEPNQDARTSWLEKFELHRPLRLLLDDHRTIADATSGNQVTDPHPDEIAAPKLAINRKVEQGSVPQSMSLI
jgi:hypothetical protein